MGQKVHPIGFRLGIIKTWDSRWYAKKNYAALLHEDIKIRSIVKERLTHAGVSKIEIERAGQKAKINIQEIRRPELEAQLVAENIALQLERRIAFRRAMKKSVTSALRLGAQGIKITCAGRLAGAEIARTEWYREGRVPLHTLRADIQYGFAEAKTTMGQIGVKVWIYKGDVLQQPKAV